MNLNEFDDYPVLFGDIPLRLAAPFSCQDFTFHGESSMVELWWSGPVIA